MKGLGVALWAESIKARKSKMFAGTIIFFVFMGIMMGLIMFVARHPEIAGRSATMSAKVSMIGNGDWTSFLGLLVQMILTLGTIGSGLVTSWVFGREYSEKVIKDIIALPVSRETIVFSKLIVSFCWSIMLSLILFIAGLFTGLLTNMPGWSEISIFQAFMAYFECSILNFLLCGLVAFVASVGRGYLLSFAYVILTMIITQIIFVGIPSLTIYLPWALPALHCGIAGQEAPIPSLGCYAIFAFMAFAGFVGTAAWWRYADQKQ
jgi:ABC-2 type transport system permease protein